MSISSSIIILVVLIIRVLLKKAPKIFSYCLWAFVFFRLICPISFTSRVSVLQPIATTSTNGTVSYIEENIATEYISKPIVENSNEEIIFIDSLQGVENNAVSTNKMSFVIEDIFVILWIMGTLTFTGVLIYQDKKLRKMIQYSLKTEENICECEEINSPFVYGIFKPLIYIPMGLEGQRKKLVLMHEKTHIKRLDPIFKFIAMVALVIH